ncbi:OLC1v1017167C1 [Oldenlandia corymbosa var. corymbosa]|uniref:OLC1v1017167C1 n=1 Tax=Oldenlandia corymbosa var. corymbosa TaxID=529605 RepID=A0AAV1E8V5_OLDCO|nr:OLC1v1017167C1 [Oldenlandia corymbosa var. corymbosa]
MYTSVASKAMEKYSTSIQEAENNIRREEKGRLNSCWGRLKLMIPWTRSKKSRRNHHHHHRNSLMHGAGNMMMISGCDCVSVSETCCIGHKPPAISFRYSPSSYAQNFDEWVADIDDEQSILVDFSSRYAAPHSSSTK